LPYTFKYPEDLEDDISPRVHDTIRDAIRESLKEFRPKTSSNLATFSGRSSEVRILILIIYKNHSIFINSYKNID
jgi:hypothetical protein